ncbi:MAG TPA: carbohydrate-binding family 9-like protein, partial [candidate division Zixibacteria bacterium]|nr:carbohydrate-binding family 9-like protein [candidate division Zixibacteria bacterium]
QARWTELFTDIEGDRKPAPRFRTRAKMLWDSTCFYIGAELAEPHVWATLTRRDAVIYHDNDFEVFIDPDADTHEYYELEVNALNTVWDLLLLKPYRDGGPAVNAWDIAGLQTAVAVEGTLNDPSDVDSGWRVEIAIPWAVLAECAHRPSPPREGDRWKVNFSRVEWQVEARDGVYAKVTDPATGRPLPEDNWVWSPQGLIAMHYPEMWGLVQFSAAPPGSPEAALVADPADSARWALRQVYYAERNYQAAHGRFTAAHSDLALETAAPRGFTWPPALRATEDRFEAEVVRRDGGGALRITEDGRTAPTGQAGG